LLLLLVGLLLRLLLDPLVLVEDEEEDELLPGDDKPADDDEVRDNEGTELEVALLEPISTSPPLFADEGLFCEVLRLPLLLL